MGKNFYGWCREKTLGKCTSRHWQPAFCASFWQVLRLGTYWDFVPTFMLIFEFWIIYCYITVVCHYMILIMYIVIWWRQISVLLIGKLVYSCCWNFPFGFVLLLNSVYLELQYSSKETTYSFIRLFVCNFSFEDPGPHGSGRYYEHMLPEIEKKEFRKGSQVKLLLIEKVVFSTKLA